MRDKLNGTLTYIETNTQLTGHVGLSQSEAVGQGRANAIGLHYAKLIRDKILTGGINRNNLESALSLSESRKNSAVRKEQRQIIRAIVLAELTVRGKPLNMADSLREQWLAFNDTEQLRRGFRSMFPTILSAQGRTAWGPGFFTDPRTLPPFADVAKLPQTAVITRDGRNTDLMLMVHSLPDEGSTINTLADPQKTLRKWSAISTSLVNRTKAIIYGNVGLILTCDAMGIMSASGSDQQFANHTGTGFNRKGAAATGDQILDNGRLTEEIQRKFYEVNDEFNSGVMRLMSPGQVLEHTDLDGSKRFGQMGIHKGWNEVTVAGPLITITGLFVKVQRDGSLKQKSSGGAVLPVDTQRAVRNCSQKYQLPIVALLDSRDAG